MRVIRAVILSAVLAWPGMGALADKAGAFDYYVLALSWSPNWCALEGEARGAEQCDQAHGWVLHGLWPQHERGWPSFCNATTPAPSQAMTGAMADIMGSGGAAWHQWRKHGVCAGLSARDYFTAARAAFDAVAKPEVLTQLDRPVRLPATVIEEAFLAANPGLAPDMITITCRDGHIQEARICLTRDLTPRRCGPDVIRDCSLRDALFQPMD